MNAASFDIGPNMVAVLGPIVAGVVLWVQNRKTAAQFGNNGGSTLRDAIDRIEESLADIGQRVGLLEHPLPPPHQGA